MAAAQDGFDGEAGREHGVVAKRRAPDHHADRELVGTVARQAEGAAVEEVDGARVAKQLAVDREKPLVAREQRRDLRCHDRHGGGEQGVDALQGALHAGDPGTPRRHQIDVVGGAHCFATADPTRDARVVLAFVLGQPAAVKGPRLDRREAARRGDRGDVAEQRQVDRFDPEASAAQAREAAVEGAGNRGVEAVEHERAGHGQAPLAGFAALERNLALGQDLVQHDGVANRAGDRRGGVERRRQRHRSIGRDQPGRALEADQALQGGRDADRAAGVGAERRPCRPDGNRDRSARGGAAGDPRCRIEPGGCCVGRRAMVRIDADAGEGELGHVGAADEPGAGAPQPLHHRCVLGSRRRRGQDPGAGGADLAGDVEEILDRHRQAGERARIAPARDQPIGVGGRLASSREAGGDEGVVRCRRLRGGDRLLDEHLGGRASGEDAAGSVGQVVAHRDATIQRFASGGSSGS